LAGLAEGLWAQARRGRGRAKNCYRCGLRSGPSDEEANRGVERHSTTLIKRNKTHKSIGGVQGGAGREGYGFLEESQERL